MGGGKQSRAGRAGQARQLVIPRDDSPAGDRYFGVVVFRGFPHVLDSCEGETEGFGFRTGHGVIEDRNVLVALSLFVDLDGVNIGVWIRDR